MPTISKTLESLLCAKCGSTYKGEALQRLPRRGIYERVQGFLFEQAWCVCTDARNIAARPTLFFPLEEQNFVVGRDCGNWRSSQVVLLPVKSTPTQLVLQLNYGAGTVIRFDRQGFSRKEKIRIEDEELTWAIKLCEKGP